MRLALSAECRTEIKYELSRNWWIIISSVFQCADIMRWVTSSTKQLTGARWSKKRRNRSHWVDDFSFAVLCARNCVRIEISFDKNLNHANCQHHLARIHQHLAHIHWHTNASIRLKQEPCILSDLCALLSTELDSIIYSRNLWGSKSFTENINHEFKSPLVNAYYTMST